MIYRRNTGKNLLLHVEPFLSLNVLNVRPVYRYLARRLTISRRHRFNMAERPERNEDEDGKEAKIISLNHVQNPTQKTRVDGGYSWIVCGAGFLIQCIVAAQGNISGIIFVALLDEYNSNRSQTGKKKDLFLLLEQRFFSFFFNLVFPDKQLILSQ